MPFVTVGKENSSNIELYYEDHGTGKPVVLIHGYPLSGRAWEKQVPALIDAGYRVITYDRRGFGNSSQPWSGYNYDTFADDLHTLLVKLDLKDVTLVGHSMGGGEIARFIGKFGTHGVSKVVFVSAITPYLRKAADNPEGVDPALFDGIKQAVVKDRPVYLMQFLTDFFNTDVTMGKLVSEEAVRANWVVAAGASPKATLDCVDTWGTDFRNDVKRIDVPTLVIHGNQDRIVPLVASGARMPHMIKGAKLVVVEGGTHGLPWTHAAQVNEALLAFVGREKTAVAA